MLSHTPSTGPTSDAPLPPPPATAAAPPMAAEAPGPAPESPQLTIPAANITVVRTAEELQQASLSGAVDIEIRAHLDLRSLDLAANPVIVGVETVLNRKRFALMYATLPLRSIRGNCADPQAEAALGLPRGTFPDLLPLKPRQCLLVVEDTWLMVNGGRLWIDNVYLKLVRQHVRPYFAFITAGAEDESLIGLGIESSSIYVTATTFHAEHRGNARAIICDFTGVAVYAEDCIFTDWAGFLSPITLKFQSVATIRDCVFRNMYLRSEIVDVSFEGIVNFQNATLVNVTLVRGSVVSTTLNDYATAIGYYLSYYAEDDANFDVPVSLVQPSQRSVFQEQFVVLNSSISDCVYLLRDPDVLLPGCPDTAAEARNRTIQRSYGTSDGSLYGTGISFDYLLPVEGPEAADYGMYDLDLDPNLSELSEYEVLNDPWRRLDVIARGENAWLAKTQEVLPTRPPAPDWPPFIPPAPPQRQKTSLLPDPDISPATAAAMLKPLAGPTPTVPAPAPGVTRAHDAGDSGRRIDVLATLFFSVAAVLILAGALLWLWVSLGSRRARWGPCIRIRSRHRASHQQATPTPESSSALKTIHREHDGSGSGSDVSRGADIPPASPLNPDYEYALPTHLALIAQPPSASLASESEYEPGSTVVVAPYTVGSACTAALASPCAEAAAQDGVKAGAEITQSEQQQQLQGELCAEGVSAGGSGGKTHVTMQKTDMVTSVRAARWLQGQLDSFTAADLFLGRFEMLGPHHRRRGGQAVVQFVQGRWDRCEFAVKFFLDRAAFLTEAALYATAFPHIRSTVSPAAAALADAPTGGGGTAAVPMAQAVARFLPQVEAVCDGTAGGLEDPRGRPLPPCIVLEKGESLQDLCDRAEPDVFTVFSVLSNVARRMADMHAAGYVHRDLKPANVMWLPRQNRWTVIDFGCVARVREQAPLSFSLTYAAPEVAKAWRERRGSIEAQPALDGWSLGVMAFELLTGAPAFDLLAHGQDKVVAMLAGDLPLPWEGPGDVSPQVKTQLGVLRRPVLQLLQREATRRSSLEAFHASCTRIFAISTSTAPSQG